MRIVLVNQFYPPARAPTGRLLADLAEELRTRGHMVTVLASPASYGEDQARADGESSAGIRVVHIGRQRAHGSGFWSKLADYASFYRETARYVGRMDPAPDLAVYMTTPPLIGLIGSRGRRKGIPYALWCMDLYPEALAAHGLLGRGNPVYALLRRLARVERGRAGAVFTLGPDMTALVSEHARDTVCEVPVWSDLVVDETVRAAAAELRRARGWGEDELIFLYSGNMGRAHRAEEFARLARMLKGTGRRFRFIFSGGGPNLERWRHAYAEVFEFLPAADGASVAAHLYSADVHLVSQEPDWTGVVVPSKFQAACAVGRPVVYAGPVDSSVASWIRQGGAGWVLPPGDDAAIESVARMLDRNAMAERGRGAADLFYSRFTRTANVGTIADRLEQLVVNV